MKLLRYVAVFALLASIAGCTSPAPSGGQCSFNADCASGLICAANYCVMPCGAGGTCPSGMRCEPVVGTALTVCAPTTEEPRCVYASDCPGSLVCNRDGRCRPECVEDYDCRVINPFTTCVEGACELRCAAGTANCDGLVRNGCEVDTRTDGAHCGACGTVCRAGANQSSRCAAGACAVSCNAGYADCDGDPANGCEADLSAPATCGACTNRCAAPTSLCQASNGQPACVSSCGGATPMECGGRCVDPQADVANCGGCGNACAAGPNSTATCAAGRCGITCAAGFGDCDNNPANGCETDLSTSAGNCGACGTTCASGANGTGRCVAGRCGIACAAGFGDCDNDPANGCETDLSSSAGNCGACGTACAAGANATAQCAEGACGITCAMGFADCDENPANGCEADLSTSNSHCGACGRACALTGATSTCRAGACSLVACTTGRADCDENPANGCEADLTSVSSCASCGRVCGSANNTPTCTTQGCSLACNAGFGNCDGNAANGCETAVNTLTNCGGCGTVCGSANNTPACTGGRCVLRCNQGFADCDGNPANGCEVNLTLDNANCGTCGNSCAVRTTQTGASHVCTAAACLPANDTCGTAQVINLAGATPVTVRASTRYARQQINAPCTKGSGPDVWFRFTLTQREIVYADTLGATWDTVLHFATDCTTPLRITSETSEVACNDDVSSRCELGGTASQIYAVLDPGTYYIVLSAYSTEVGDVTLNVQHVPVGAGSVNEYPVGFFEGLNFLFGNLGQSSATQGTCGGVGPETSFWFATCPGDAPGRFVANTCSSVNQGFNTVLYLRSGNGAPEVCNNDAPADCPNNPQGSSLDTTVSGAPGVHVLTLDSFDTSGTTGSFELRSAYPYFEPQLQ
ncbi:MAG: hypothetical protein R3A48_00670 [Polyangiales bacterium]